MAALVDIDVTPVIYSDCDPRRPDVSVPKYEQLAAIVRDQIRRGDLKPGQQLPPYSAFEAEGWRHTTIVTAMRSLRDGGWTRHQQGEGIFVHDHPPV